MFALIIVAKCLVEINNNNAIFIALFQNNILAVLWFCSFTCGHARTHRYVSNTTCLLNKDFRF
jgi:hypothetical protein